MPRKRKKPSVTSVPNALAVIVLKQPGHGIYPTFDSKYHVIEPEPGRRLLLREIGNQEVIHVPDETLGNELLSYCRDKAVKFDPRFDITYRQAIETARYIIAVAPLLRDSIAPILFLSELGFTYRRLPFDPVRGAHLDQAPTWAEIISRMTNSPAYCMRMASLFDSKASRKQCVYVFSDKGDATKSQIAALLQRIGGPTVVIVSNEDLRTLFWKASLLGKRVMIVGEATTDFLRNSSFKSLTGDQRHSINQKNKPIICVDLNVILFLFSNDPPLINNDHATINRIIDVRMVPFTGKPIPEAVYQEMLWSELPVFLGYCLDLYAHYADGRRIPSDQLQLKQIAETDDAEALDFFENNFVAEKGAKMAAYLVSEKLRLHGVPTQLHARWKKVWTREYGVAHRRSPCQLVGNTPNGKRIFYYHGMRERESIYAAQRDDKIPGFIQAMSVTEEDLALFPGSSRSVRSE